MKTIRFAKADRTAKKGEDFCSVASSNICGTLESGYQAHMCSLPAVLGVYDGHGGRLCASLCAEHMGPRLLQLQTPYQPSDIENTFWLMDQDIGTGRLLEGGYPVQDGSTAQVLLLEPDPTGNAIRGSLAWCGDSKAIVVDMRTGEQVLETENHSPKLASEAERLELSTRIRAELERTFSIDTHYDPIDKQQIMGMFAATGRQAGAEEIDLMDKALCRGRLIAATLPHGAPSRKNAFNQRRSKANGESRTRVISTAREFANPEYNDLQMTRSIGDWRASDFVLPHPQIQSFRMEEGKHYRVLLASDGLWDVVSSAEACRLLCAAHDVDGAAVSLLQAAEKEYLEVRRRTEMGDDTTVMVVDLNLSLSAPTEQTGATLAATKEDGSCILG